MKRKVTFIILLLVLIILTFLFVFFENSDIIDDEEVNYGVGFKTTASVLNVTDVNPFEVQTNPFEGGSG